MYTGVLVTWAGQRGFGRFDLDMDHSGVVAIKNVETVLRDILANTGLDWAGDLVPVATEVDAYRAICSEKKWDGVAHTLKLRVDGMLKATRVLVDIISQADLVIPEKSTSPSAMMWGSLALSIKVSIGSFLHAPVYLTD